MTTSFQVPTGHPPVRRHSQARYWLAGAGVVVLAASGLAAAGVIFAHRDSVNFTAAGIHTVVLTEEAGDIHLVAGGGPGQVHVQVVRHWSWTAPDVQHDVHDGVLTVSGECSGFSLGRCGTDQIITIPAGVTVRAHTSAGDISANEVTADALDLQTTAGDISIEAADAPDVHAVSSAGDISATLRGPVRKIDVRTTAGDVRLRVPEQSYRVQAKTAAGDLTIAVRQDPAATDSITAQTSAGDIDLRTS